MRVSEIIRMGNFARVVELFPPGLPSPEFMKESQRFDLSARFETLVDSISELEAIADAFSLPELKDAGRIHLNSIAVASELKRRTGSDIIPTITLRDSNRQNLLGSVSYSIFAGLENLQVVRGDPYLRDDRSEPKNVYDIPRVSSFVKLIRKIESHLSNAERVCVLAPINLGKIEDTNYLETVRQRESAGVDIFLTESLFEDTGAYLDRVLQARSYGIKPAIIHNIFPFKSYEDAVACVEKFGWKVSDEELHGLKTQGPKFGIDLARKRYESLLDKKDIAQGACISTRGNLELVRMITA